jgi:hypothetical protein
MVAGVSGAEEELVADGVAVHPPCHQEWGNTINLLHISVVMVLSNSTL